MKSQLGPVGNAAEGGGRKTQDRLRGRDRGSAATRAHPREIGEFMVYYRKLGGVQSWAKEWSLGCVNPASGLPLAMGGVKFTQPRDYSLAHPCISTDISESKRDVSDGRICYLIHISPENVSHDMPPLSSDVIFIFSLVNMTVGHAIVT